MKRVLRSLFVIAWTLFGFLGIGIIVGALWLTGAMERTNGAHPPVQFVAGESARPSACRLPSRFPDSFEALVERMRDSGYADLPSYARMLVTCADDPDATAALIASLRASADSGDPVAAMALDALSRAPCALLTALAGVPPERSAVTTKVCMLAIPRRDGSIAAIEGEVDEPTRTFRLAQLLALIEAGAAAPSAVAQFCADVADLPVAVQVLLVKAYPNLPRLMQERCGAP